MSIGAVIDGTMIAAVIYEPERDEMYRASTEGATINGEQLRAVQGTRDDDSVLFTGFPYEGGHATAQDHEQYRAMIGSFRSVKRLGSSALGLAYVAAGRGGVALELNANPWDISAGLYLVQQAGGRFVTQEGTEKQPLECPTIRRH